eukprot:COSAG02_NODE_18408_length_940_cov_93.449465_1_plen_43_part_01
MDSDWIAGRGSPLNRAYCARLGMTGNSILARNLSQRNSGTDCA